MLATRRIVMVEGEEGEGKMPRVDVGKCSEAMVEKDFCRVEMVLVWEESRAWRWALEAVWRGR